MRKPEPPPPSVIESEADFAALRLVFTSADVREKIDQVEGEYLYWDRFKYKAAGLGIAPEMLWKYAKFRRNQGINYLKISNVAGFIFKYNQTPNTLRLLHQFDLNLGGALEGPTLIPHEDKQRYLISSIMEEAIASSQLEGAATTREIAKEMLRTQRKPRNVSETMILNNYLTMQKILACKDQPLSLALILDIQATIAKGTLEKEEYEGQFRANDNVNVVDATTGEVFYCPPPHQSVLALMERVCDFANAKNDEAVFIHPIVRGIILHFLIGYIHPFFDGNGRTARAIFYWYLLSKGYWLIEYLSISRIILKSSAQYAKSYLHTEYDENDLTYFIDYNLKSMDLALKSLKEYIGKKIKEKSQLFAVIRHENINERQVEILRDLMSNDEKIMTIAQIQTAFGVVYQTARTDLLGLVQLGYLVAKTSGKKTLFFKSVDFENKIKQRPH